MRKEFEPKPWLFPQPVLIIGTFDENDKPNAMNAAWGGTYDFKKVIISLSTHKTTDNLKIHKAFSLSFGTKETAVVCDFVGLVSQDRYPNKMDKAGLHYEKSNKVHAPIFLEFPLTMECVVEKFDEEEGILIGEVVGISVDEKVIKDNKIDSSLLHAIVFDPINNKYRIVCDAVADAFKDGFKLK